MELKFKRNIKFISLAALISLVGAIPSHACSACFFGDPTQKSIVAAQWGVLVLLAAVLGVLAAFAKFFISFNKRAQQLNKANPI